MFLAQVIDIAYCYPPQQEGGEFPRREFAEAPEESASIAPMTSRASAKRKNVAKVAGWRIQKTLMAVTFLLMKMTVRPFLQNLSTVALLLKLERKFFQSSASMLRKYISN
jgi:hypothetical protein